MDIHDQQQLKILVGMIKNPDRLIVSSLFDSVDQCIAILKQKFAYTDKMIDQLKQQQNN